ncbi:MAG TPA: hypothetical protein VN923_06100, partial [Thermoanaerobaculia bacterium]|nr:hypothetical protein [Thermoanaerobaculia bacterium]
VGEVAWRRERYEGPGRPPGMAVRFVALEAVAIEMLAVVLGAEPMVDEVLKPRPLPVRESVPASAAVAEERDVEELSLEQLITESGFATPPALGPPAPLVDDDVDDPEGAVIFVPPPLLPVPALAVAASEVADAGASVPPLASSDAAVTAPPSPLRWGSAAAGIAAIAALATLAVVGAARRQVVVVAEPGVHAAASGTTQQATTSAAQMPATVAPVDATVGPPAARPEVAATAPVAARALPTMAARSLVSLRWEPLAGGGTRVVLALDGSLARERLRVSRIGGESPRLVVRLLGIGGGAPRAPWEPGTSEVRRVRAGRHAADDGDELHLVLDLADDGVRLGGSDIIGSEVRLDLQR